MDISNALPSLGWVFYIGWRLYCMHVSQLARRIAVVLAPTIFLGIGLYLHTHWWVVFLLPFLYLALRIASLPAIRYLAHVEQLADAALQQSQQMRTIAYLFGTLLCELVIVFGPSVLVGSFIGACIRADNSEDPCAVAMHWAVPLFLGTAAYLPVSALYCAFTAHLVIFHGHPPIDALRYSCRFVHHHWQSIVGVDAVSLAVLILCQLPTVFVARYLNHSLALLICLTLIGSTFAHAFYIVHISLLYRMVYPPQPAPSGPANAT